MVSLSMGEERDVEHLLADLRPRLSRALIATYGLERGGEAFAEAMVWAWEHRDELPKMQNPAGYLYRVGQSKSRPRQDPPVFPEPADVGVPWVEPALPSALRELTEHQRVCVVMVHGYGWTHREVADLIGVATSTVQNHVERGLANLRRHLEVMPDA